MEENKSENLFRQESLDRISSPERIDAFVRLPSPSLWLPAGALALLALGAGLSLYIYSL